MAKQHHHTSDRGGLSPLAGIVAGLGAMVGGWLGYSALFVDHHAPLPSAIDAERKQFLSRESGLLSYYADTAAQGTPLVLIHSINAAASSNEMRPLFNHFRSERPVYALDLPGFGFSERSNRPYSPHLYAGAIQDFLTTQVRQPADVVALSLGSEFVARAAMQLPGIFRSITMISPSGFTLRPAAVSSQGASMNQTSNLAYSLFSFPLWSQAFYDLLATPPSIHYFLKKSFVGPVFPALADYAHATAHQPGARYAPLFFVSGKLFTPDIRETIYDTLKMPVLVIYDLDPYVRFDALESFIQTRANWYTSRIVPSRGLPQFEHLTDTAQALVDFWAAQEPLRPVEATRLSGWNAQDAE
jgi:pimeloyl-ACP methyl ester carboxylesterase